MKKRQVSLIIKSHSNVIVEVNAFYNKSYATSFFLKECTRCNMRPKDLPKTLRDKEYYTAAKSVSLRTIRVPTKRRKPLRQIPGVKVPMSPFAKTVCWITYIGLAAFFFYLLLK